MIIDTLTFSNTSQGWTSRWTYRPEWMIGLNNSFYTFKDGSLWQHDVNQEHCVFYDNYDSNPYFSISTIINEAPTEVKMFKTLVIDGTTGLNISGYTDLDQVEMSSSQFIDKEGNWYAYLKRPYNQISYDLLSTQGVGIVDNVASTTMSINATISNVDQGDTVYKELNGLVELVGIVQSVTLDSITVVSYTTVPSVGDYIFIVKNAEAESYGARGYYLNLSMSLLGQPAQANHELFAINSSIFKSFP